VNTNPYRGIAPRQTYAQKYRRALIARIGSDEVTRQDAERVEYYRDLIRQARALRQA
jgi:hypothetical protein